MARIRTVKPEFFTSEDVMALSPLARLLFIGLWCESDREGRMKWTPDSWKARYLPSDDCEIELVTDELVTRGLVVKYASDMREYAHVPTFLQHQVINPRERESALPPPEGRKEGKGRKEGTASLTRGYTREFENFWNCYPNKKGKGAAEKAFGKIKPDDQLMELMLDAIFKQKQSAAWMKDGGEFIPHPATWLNQKRWEDEVAPAGIGGKPKTDFEKSLEPGYAKLREDAKLSRSDEGDVPF